MSDTRVFASILSANFAQMGQGLEFAEKNGVDGIHLDIMDGSFVPNISYGQKMVADLRPLTKLFFDVHLMVMNPERHLESFIKAGANSISFHIEASKSAQKLLAEIKSYNTAAGIAINPATPISKLKAVLPFVDTILVMTVNPGYGGQPFIPETMAKIEWLIEKKQKLGYSYKIAVDGGIAAKTAPIVKRAGASILVTGSAFYESSEPRNLINSMRNE